MEGEDDLVCEINTQAYDAEGDSITYTFEWFVDGVAYTNATTTSEIGDTIPTSETVEDELWTCTITPNDGTEDGPAATDTVKILGCPFGFIGWDNTIVDTSAADYKFLGRTSSGWAGYSVSSAGDVNGDGNDDILIGAYNANSGGEAYLILGASLGSTTELDLNNANYRFVGENYYDDAGYSVSSAGDVDGDGKDDILIGAPGETTGGTDAGAVYLILGKNLGNTTTIDLSNANYKFIGTTYSYAGRYFSSVGNVDGDDKEDIIIGTQGRGTFLFLGKSLGNTTEIDLSDADYKFIGNTYLNSGGIGNSSPLFPGFA